MCRVNRHYRPDPIRIGVLDIVAGVYDVTHKNIVMRHHAESYQTAVWWLRRAANLSLKDTAEAFEVSPSRISHIQRMIESRGLTQRERKSCKLCKTSTHFCEYDHFVGVPNNIFDIFWLIAGTQFSIVAAESTCVHR
jgi:hypothetical protein